MNCLKQSSYILINYNDHHSTGNSCSGSLQLALSTLCRPIMTTNSNKYLQIENALEFDINSDEPINIDNEIDFKVLEQERNKYVDKFAEYLKIISESDNIYLRILSDEGITNNLETWMNTDNLEYMYNKPVILTNSNNFTHAIIINDYKPKLTIPKENVILGPIVNSFGIIPL